MKIFATVSFPALFWNNQEIIEKAMNGIRAQLGVKESIEKEELVVH